MIQFIIRRLLLMIPTTIGVALVVFGIYHAAPGDAATVMMGISSGGNMSSTSKPTITAVKRRRGALEKQGAASQRRIFASGRRDFCGV